MALVLANRVQETATPNTTVSFTLTGAVSGFQTFAVIGNGNTTYYSATDSSGNWEVGDGLYLATGTILVRNTIYASSNSGSAVTFPGSVNVFVTYPSGKSVNLDGSGNVSALGTVSSGTWQGSTVGVAYGGTGVTTSSGPNSVVLRDSNSNITVNRISQGLQTITASGGVTTLTAASQFNQALTGTGGHTFRLPDATTLTDTTTFQFNNNATGTLTIENNAGTTIGTVAPGGAAGIALLSNATVGGTWDVHAYIPEGVTWGTNALDLGTTVISNGTWQGGTIQSGYGGTGLTTFAGANNALYSTSASALAAGTLPVAAGGTGLTSYTLNGVVYASGTGTLATGSALTFNGTNLINSGAYTAPSNGAGAGIKTTIQGSTGTGQANATGGNGYIELIGGGGTSSWTSFTIGVNQRRRGGINLQAGTAAADAGATYVNGSSIDILGSSGTNNGTLTGAGSRVFIQSGSTTKIDTYVSGGSSFNAGGATLSAGGAVGINGGNFGYAAGYSNGGGSIAVFGGSATQSGQVTVVSGTYNGSGGSNGGATFEASPATVTTGGNIRLRPGVGLISGSTSGKAYVTNPVTSIDNEILTTASIFSTTFASGTVNGVLYLNGSQQITSSSAFLFDANKLLIDGCRIGIGSGPSDNIVFGNSALLSSTGTSNIAIGLNASRDVTSGDNNVALGANTLRNATTASLNIAIGSLALTGVTEGYRNIAIGYEAAKTTATGFDNVSIGYGAHYNLTSNYNSNVAVGTRSLYTGGGSDNTAVGHEAGFDLITGYSNVFMGRRSGQNAEFNQFCTYLGSRTASSGSTRNQEVVVAGTDSTLAGKGSNTFFAYANTGGGVGGSYYNGANTTTWTTISDERIKTNFVPVTNGLAVVTALEPTEFNYIIGGKHEVGFKAQQYMTVLPEQVSKNAASPEEKNLVGEDEIYGITRNLDPYFVSAIKTLADQVEQLRAEINLIKNNPNSQT